MTELHLVDWLNQTDRCFNTSPELLFKTKEGIQNLLYIFNGYHDKKQLINSVKLLKYAEIINRFYLRKLINFTFLIFENYLLKNPRIPAERS